MFIWGDVLFAHAHVTNASPHNAVFNLYLVSGFVECMVGLCVCVCVGVCWRVLAACVLKGYSVWLCVTVVQSLEM